jgi:hypothetical protein
MDKDPSKYIRLPWTPPPLDIFSWPEDQFVYGPDNVLDWTTMRKEDRKPMCIENEESEDFRGYSYPSFSPMNLHIAMRQHSSGQDTSEVLKTFHTRWTFQRDQKHIQILSRARIVDEKMLMRVQYIIWTPPSQQETDHRPLMPNRSPVRFEAFLPSENYVSFLFRNVHYGYEITPWVQHVNRMASCRIEHQKKRAWEKKAGRTVTEPEVCKSCAYIRKTVENSADYGVDVINLVDGKTDHGMALWVTRWFDLGNGEGLEKDL